MYKKEEHDHEGWRVFSAMMQQQEEDEAQKY